MSHRHLKLKSTKINWPIFTFIPLYSPLILKMVDLSLLIKKKKKKKLGNTSRFLSFLYSEVQSAKLDLLWFRLAWEGNIGKHMFPGQSPLPPWPKCPSEPFFSLLHCARGSSYPPTSSKRCSYKLKGKPNVLSPLIPGPTPFFAALPKPTHNSVQSPFTILSSNDPIWECFLPGKLKYWELCISYKFRISGLAQLLTHSKKLITVYQVNEWIT